MNVVIVDDEKHIADGLKKLIEHVDAETTVIERFYDSAEALAWFRRHPGEAELLITDIRMPGMDGLTLAREAKQADGALQVAILSGYGEFDYAKTAIDVGVLGYLLKPVDSGELAGVLRSAREKSGHARPAAREAEPKVVRQIRAYLEKHYRSFAMAEMSAELGLSADYMGRLFKKVTGVTIGDRLLEIRMKRAAELLGLEENRKIYEVALLVGYEDPAFFSRQFKSVYGVTPKEYQNGGTE